MELETVASIAAAISAQQSYRAVKEMRRAERMSVHLQRQRDTGNMVVGTMPRTLDKVNSALEEAAKSGGVGPDDVGLREAVGLYEQVAASINSGAFDFELVNKTSGGMILDAYSKTAAFQRCRRWQSKRIYDQMQTLVDHLIQAQHSTYRVTVRDLATLASAWGFSSVSRMPLGSVGRDLGEHECDELFRTLASHRVPWSVWRSTLRKSNFGIRVASATDRGAIAAMIATLPDDVYPPNISRDVAASARWLSADLDASFVGFDRLTGELLGHVGISFKEPDHGAASAFEEAREDAQHREHWEGLAHSRFGFVKKLIVAPSARRRSLGRLMFRHAISSLERTGLSAGLFVLDGAETGAARTMYELEGGRSIAPWITPHGASGTFWIL